MIYLKLILGFLKVGLFSFGGAYSAIPLIREVVEANNWMDDEALAQMIAISESTPGPLMVNLATYVGSSQAGIIGSIIATASVVLPAFVIIILLMTLLKNLWENRCFKTVLGAMTPCITGIISATGIYMIANNCFAFEQGFEFDIKAIIITAVLALLYFGSRYILKKKMSPILLIVISAVIGIFAFGF